MSKSIPLAKRRLRIKRRPDTDARQAAAFKQLEGDIYNVQRGVGLALLAEDHHEDLLLLALQQLELQATSLKEKYYELYRS